MQSIEEETSQPGLLDADDAESLLSGAGHPLKRSQESTRTLLRERGVPTFGRYEPERERTVAEVLGGYDRYKGGA